eukprot:TRINITY_DN83020_c0_g1_i1.p1 TRINITY_DN83020_c0_g1~~TRINITY_DN83020_c0_g1_i1.p1  ORF type:complete len:400 (-),score=62.34 TRINITY_DN83020_c0_g1_i1:171-1325(-)
MVVIEFLSPKPSASWSSWEKGQQASAEQRPFGAAAARSQSASATVSSQSHTEARGSASKPAMQACAPGSGSQSIASLLRQLLGGRRCLNELRVLGGLIALTCVAVAGLLLLLGLAVIALSGHGGNGALVQPAPAVILKGSAASPHPVCMGEAPTCPGAQHVASAVEDLRRDLRRQERLKELADLSTSTRLKHLESRLSERDLPAPGQRRLAFELGIDWAAAYAGGHIDSVHTSLRLEDVYAVGSSSSLGAAVLIAADEAAPTACVSFRGNGSVAVKLPRTVRVTDVGLEHSPHFVKDHAAPRYFEVWAAAKSGNRPVASWPGLEAPFSILLGAFEYDAMAEQAAQTFRITPLAVEAAAVKFVFHDSSGKDFTRLCRIRVIGPLP